MLIEIPNTTSYLITIVMFPPHLTIFETFANQIKCHIWLELSFHRTSSIRYSNFLQNLAASQRICLRKSYTHKLKHTHTHTHTHNERLMMTIGKIYCCGHTQQWLGSLYAFFCVNSHTDKYTHTNARTRTNTNTHTHVDINRLNNKHYWRRY